MSVAFLADENVPRVVVDHLRSAGLDVEWISETAPGASDEAVLERAHRTDRVLVTFDKDFGELAFQRAHVPPGVVLIRTTGLAPSGLGELVTAVIASRDDWVGMFSVITNRRLRMRPIPPRRPS